MIDRGRGHQRATIEQLLDEARGQIDRQGEGCEAERDGVEGDQGWLLYLDSFAEQQRPDDPKGAIHNTEGLSSVTGTQIRARPETLRGDPSELNVRDTSKGSPEPKRTKRLMGFQPTPLHGKQTAGEGVASKPPATKRIRASSRPAGRVRDLVPNCGGLRTE